MLKKLIVRIILVAFLFTSIGPFPDVSAQTIIDLPAPGMMVNKSNAFQPLELKGILVNVKNPLRFDFLVDKGASGLYGKPLKDEIIRSAKYFLTCLAVPENDLWVNLSPYEKDRIVPGNFGITLMGRDLLQQDYLLKQIMASLSYPENDLGKRFWQKVYHKSFELYGTTEIPINTFNKVWILPKSAQVYVQGNAAFVVNSQLDVMLEADYKSFTHHLGNKSIGKNSSDLSQNAGAYSQVFREVILPELRQEVNRGKNFTVVRQVYNAMILATWYKRHLKNSLLGKLYVGRNKVSGVDIEDKHAKEKIYQQYLKAYKKCVYNYIKEDYDPFTQQTIPRKYASGGVDLVGFGVVGNSKYQEVHSSRGMDIGTNLAMATVDVSPRNADGAMISFDPLQEITHTHPFYFKYRKTFSDQFTREVLPKAVSFGLYNSGRQNAAMISMSKISAAVRNFLFALVLVTGLSVAAPRAAKAAQFMPNSRGTSIQVRVEKNDTFGQILVDAGYTKMPLWGEKGAVREVGKVVKPSVQNVNQIYPGEKFVIPTKSEFKLEHTKTVNLKTVSPHIEKTSSNALLNQQKNPAPIKYSDSPKPSIGSLPKKIAVPSVKMSPSKVLSTQGNPAPATPNSNGLYSRISDFVKAQWPWAVGMAVFGIGLKVLKGFRPKPNTQRTQISGGPDLGPKMKEDHLSQPERPIFETSSAPHPMTDEEKALLPQLKAQLETLLVNGTSSARNPNPISNRTSTRNYPKRISGASSLPDILGWSGGMLLALRVFGFNPIALLAAALALPLVNVVSAIADILVHEWVGHAGAASLLHVFKPSLWKKFFRLSNYRLNWKFEQWKKYIISKLTWQKYDGIDPKVKLPTSGLVDKLVSYSGIAVTALYNLGLLGVLSWLSLSQPWLLPVLPVVGFNGLSAIRSAWISDSKGSVLDEETGERKHACGISVHSRIGTRKALAKQGDKVFLDRIADMMGVESDRGRHEVGLLIARQLKNGNVTVKVEKALEAKRFPFSDSIQLVTGQIEKSLPPIISQGPMANEFIMDTALGHNRLASGGKVETPAAHPHLGQEHLKILWSLYNGMLIEGKSPEPELDVEVSRPKNLDNDEEEKENINTGIGHNGDGDAYQPLPGGAFITDLDELRAFGQMLVHFQGELPPGDSPVIPLLIQFHLTQGNADASIRFAHVRTHHKSIDEIKNGMKAFSEDKEFYAGEILNRSIRKFAPILSRPGLNIPDKTLNDLFVDENLAKANPHDEQLQFQYTVIRHLIEDSIIEFKKEARDGQIPELAKHWQGVDGEKRLEDFVKLAIRKFFTGDRRTACKEFEEQSKGTYGLAVKVSTDINGLTLLSRQLGMVWGYDLEKGYLDASSDPYALLKKYKNGDNLKILMFLDPQGKGEMVNFQVSKVTGKLHVKIYSIERDKYLTEKEIYDREYPITKDNKYYRPLYEYQDERRRIIEDMNQVSLAVADLVKGFDDSNALKPPSEQDFNYQSGREVFKNLMARWINDQIEEKLLKGGEYKSIYTRLHNTINNLAIECSSEVVCSEEHKQFLRTESVATPENSLLMALVSRWLTKISLELAESRINEKISQEELKARISEVIQESADRIDALLTVKNLDIVYKYCEHERYHPFSGRERIGMLFAGDENSDYGPKSAQDIWDTFLPNLPKRFVSSHELLEYKTLPFDITSPAVTLLTSKAGGNFNTMQALDVMTNAVGKNHIWGVTSRPDSPLSVALGQRLRPDAPFRGHAFYTGDHFRAQTQGASSSLTSALHNLLPFFVALQFEKYCPGEHPFGLNLTPEKVNYFKLLKQKMMLKDSERITGRNEEGRQADTSVSANLTKRAKYLSNRLKETPLMTWLNRVAIYKIFMTGPIVLGALQLLNLVSGAGAHGLAGSLISHADYLFTLSLPAIIIFFIRLWHKYPLWVRQGPPANINVIGKDYFPDVQRMFLRVLFSRSFAAWGSQVHSARYEKSIPELGPSMARGSWIFGHIPGSPSLQRKAKGALKQLKVTRTGIFGTNILRSGAIAFTTSRGEFKPDGVVSDDNVDIGGAEFSPPDDDDMVRVYNVLDAWGANLAFIMQSSVMGDELTFKGRAWDPTRKVNNAGSLTTELAQPPPSDRPKVSPKIISAIESIKPVSEDNSTGDSNIDREKVPVGADDKSMLASKHSNGFSRDGGIDMSSRLMQFNLTGDRQNSIEFDDRAVETPLMASLQVINAVAPHVSQIVSVTPDMLKEMLGEGYLN